VLCLLPRRWLPPLPDLCRPRFRRFFNGKSFTAASPSGVKFKMTFTADGKAKRVPAGKGGARSEGEWKLDDKGYCTTWKGSAESCFTVIPNGTNKWSVMKGAVVMATWSK
jgi:hypothetical protein